jgi:hypothetical protein
MASLKYRVLATASEHGLGEEALTAYNLVNRLLQNDPLTRIDESLLEYVPEVSDHKGSVLLPMIPGTVVNNYRACIIAHAFRTRGYDPVILHCDRGLTRCLRRWIVEDSSASCDRCVVDGRRTIDAFGLDYLTVSELAPSTEPTVETDDIESVEYKGIDLSQFALATTRKYFQKYTIDLSAEYEREVYTDMLKNGITLVDIVEELVRTRDIVATMVMEDHYVHGGVPLAVSKKHGVPGYSIENGLRDGTILFGHTDNRNTFPFFTDDEVLDRRLSTPLTDAQRERIDALVSNRFEGGEDVTYQYSSDAARSIDTGEYQAIAGMFTNLIWDASLNTDDFAPYTDALQWIRETVEAFADQSDVGLVVKTHPAETAHGTRQPVGEYVRTTCGPLPPNVDVLPPDTPVNTYQMMHDIDAGIVYNTTVGLEMAYQGYPVVVAGDTHYRGLGFTHDPETKSAYHDTLGAIADLEMTPEMQERAQRYMYFLMLEKSLDFPFLSMNENATEYRPQPVAYDDIKPGNEVFDLIVEKMAAGEPVAKEP